MDPLDQLDQLHHVRGRQARGRLVQQQELGPDGQGACDLDFALGAVGQVGRDLVGQVAHAHELQEVHGLVIDGLLAVGVTPGAQQGVHEAVAEAVVLGDLDVVQHRHVVPQPDVLEGPGHAQGCDLVRFHAARVDAADFDGPGRGLVEAADKVEDRRLAGAVGPDEGAHLAALQADGQLVHGQQAAEALGQVGYFEQGHVI